MGRPLTVWPAAAFSTTAANEGSPRMAITRRAGACPSFAAGHSVNERKFTRNTALTSRLSARAGLPAAAWRRRAGERQREQQHAGGVQGRHRGGDTTDVRNFPRCMETGWY